MKLVSTRGKSAQIEASAATLRGIAPDGGLYVPTSFPNINQIGDITNLSYSRLCAKVLGLFFEDINDLETLTEKAYAKFDNDNKAPLKKISYGEYVLELWHGPTLAFKDMALSVLPLLMTAAMDKESDKDVLILVATSGDTGKAALEGFCNVDKTKIVVFYPENGVSEMQRLQMVTQQGSNTHVIGVAGNFDDAQNGVKEILTDEDFAKITAERGYVFSSANSINFGRLAPQIAYYIWAYNRLLANGDIAQGEKINFVVPTGNFGNILAAYYAKKMGLPIAKLICASNKNNVLTDFFRYGEYSLKRDFHKTMSPSMDILISSNLERLLFELMGRDTDKVKDMMRQLSEESGYAIDKAAMKALEADFYADWCDESETSACIKDMFHKNGYVIDTHTAVAACVYDKYKLKGDKKKTVIVSTASPYKFPKDVLESLGQDTEGMSVFDMVQQLSEITGTSIPRKILELEIKRIVHDKSVGKEELRKAILEVI